MNWALKIPGKRNFNSLKFREPLTISSFPLIHLFLSLPVAILHHYPCLSYLPQEHTMHAEWVQLEVILRYCPNPLLHSWESLLSAAIPSVIDLPDVIVICILNYHCRSYHNSQASESSYNHWYSIYTCSNCKFECPSLRIDFYTNNLNIYSECNSDRKGYKLFHLYGSNFELTLEYEDSFEWAYLFSLIGEWGR